MESFFLKSPLSGLRQCLGQFLTAENPLKIMNNAFYFTFKALIILAIYMFVLFFGYIEKRLDKKVKFNLKFALTYV